MTSVSINDQNLDALTDDKPEVRNRCLQRVYCKLKCGIQFDNPSRQGEKLLMILLRSFDRNRFSRDDTVASLLNFLILQNEYRIEIIKKIGIRDLLRQLNDVKFKIDEQKRSMIDQIIGELEKSAMNYPKNRLSQDSDKSYNVEPDKFKNLKYNGSATNLIKRLKSYNLLESDENILATIEEQFENDPSNPAVLHFFQFFSDVILNDFPSEIFLQRPAILLQFYDCLDKTLSNQIKQSILSCLIKITENIRIRLQIEYDKSIKNIALEEELKVDFVNNEKFVGSLLEMSIPKFVAMSLKFCFKFLQDDFDDSFKETKLILIVLDLMKGLLHLLMESISCNIWKFQTCQKVSGMLKDVNNILTEFATIFQSLRSKISKNPQSLSYRYVQLSYTFLAINFIDKFIPDDLKSEVIPIILKDSLIEILQDISVQFLYPEMYKKLINIVRIFGGHYCNIDSVRLYDSFLSTNGSIKATITLLNDKSSSLSLSLYEKLELMKNSSRIVSFHKHYAIIDQYFNSILNVVQNYDELSTDLSDVIEQTILNFMNTKDLKVQEIVYNNCYKIITDATDLISNNKLSLLFRRNILLNIIINGLNSSECILKNKCEEIIISILKFDKFIILRNWNDNIQIVGFSLPILLCYAKRNTELGKNVLRLIDPDISQSLGIPFLDVLKGNLSLLFNLNPDLRTDAIMYAFWLLISEKESDKKLPNIATTQEHIDNNICIIEDVKDVTNGDFCQNSHQKDILIRNLEYLMKSSTDRSIKRSLLNQLKYHLDNNFLHDVFLQLDGLQVLLTIFNESLIESDYNTYPDLVICVISCLRKLAVFHDTVRQQLSDNLDIFYGLLRGLFLFYEDTELRTDVAQLLFLIIFCNFIQNDFCKGLVITVNEDVMQNLQVPFSCTFQKFGDNESSIDRLTESDWGKNALRLSWNLRLYDSIENYMKHYCTNSLEIDDNYNLALDYFEVEEMRNSSIILGCEFFLTSIENSVSYGHILRYLNGISACLKINENNTGSEWDKTKLEEILKLPWELILSRFLIVTNFVTDNDKKLATEVLKVLHQLLKCYKKLNQLPWLTKSLTDPIYLKDITKIFNQRDFDYYGIILRKEYLSLLTQVINLEQTLENKTCWLYVIDIMSQNLKLAESENFQDLSLVNSLLKCLASITSNLAWSQKANYKNLVIHDLIIRLSDLMVSFQCQKSDSNNGSVIGLGIINHTLIIFYQLICEIHYFDITNYDLVIISNPDLLKWTYSLLDNQDLIVRTEILQLFAEYCKKPNNTTTLIQNCQEMHQNLWKKSVKLILDEQEAYLVREQAAELICTISSHSKTDNIYYSHFQQIKKIEDLIFYLEKWDFFKQLRSLLIVDCRNFANLILIKNILKFLKNLLKLTPTKIIAKLTEVNIVGSLLSCITLSEMTEKIIKVQNEAIQLSHTSLILINRLVTSDCNVLRTILYSKECLLCLVQLLDCDKHDYQSAQLIYFRNRIWANCFRLFYNLIVKAQNISTSVTMLSIAFNEITYVKLLRTVSISIENGSYTELQQSALVFLSAVFSNELILKRFSNKNVTKSLSVFEIQLCRQLLDLYHLRNCESKDISDIFNNENFPNIVRNTCHILSALTSLVSISNEAKLFAISDKFLERILRQFNTYHTLFELKNINTQDLSDKKLFQHILREVNGMIKLLNNIMYQNDDAKTLILNSNLISIVQKFWKWILSDKTVLIDVLKMISTLTNSITAFDGMLSTKKLAISQTLITLIVSLILKEMDLFSRSHETQILQLAFGVLENCCAISDCRSFILKNNFLNYVLRLNPAYTKKQKQWEVMEHLWLKFLHTYSYFQEGHISILNNNYNNNTDVLSVFVDLARNSQSERNRDLVFAIFKNLVFHPKNRLKFLNSNEFLQLLYEKLSSDNAKDIETTVVIIWTLVANNQRAKFSMKSKGFDIKLTELIDKLKITKLSERLGSHFNTLEYVHSLFK